MGGCRSAADTNATRVRHDRGSGGSQDRDAAAQAASEPRPALGPMLHGTARWGRGQAVTARILVVDDIAANLRLLEAKLLNEYYEVALAASGPEALATAARWSPDVILLDVMMPGMDGYEVCRRLKENGATAHMPVVMITALIDPVERVRGLEAGADDFLSKPVDDATLFARLRALLRVKQVQDAWRLRSDTARDL